MDLSGDQPSGQMVGDPVAVEPAGARTSAPAQPPIRAGAASTPEECRCCADNRAFGNGLCCCCCLCGVRYSRIPLIMFLAFLGIIATAHYSPVGGISSRSHALFGGVCFLLVFIVYLPLAVGCAAHQRYVALKQGAGQESNKWDSYTAYLGSCNRFTVISHSLVCVFTFLIILPLMIMDPLARDLNGGALEDTFGMGSPPSPSSVSFDFGQWLFLGLSTNGPYGAPSQERRREFTFKTGLPTSPPRNDCERAWATHLALDVYFPEACMEAGSCAGDTQLAPIIFHVHCGGWTQGDKSEVCGGWGNAAYFLERGYAIVSTQYRFTCHGYNVTDILSDLRDAYDYVWANAPRWHFDRNSFHLMGGSAGGHLSLLMGYALTGGNFSNGGDYSGIRSITNLYGITDIPGLQQGFGCRGAGDNYDGLTGGCDEEGKRVSSPVSYVTASSPPTLSFHGTLDLTVPYGQAELLKDELDAAGVPNFLMQMHSWEHVPERSYYGLPAQMFRYAFERLLAARK